MKFTRKFLELHMNAIFNSIIYYVTVNQSISEFEIYFFWPIVIEFPKMFLKYL